MAEMATRELLLASASVFRRKVLEAAGVACRVVPAHVDEAEIKARLTSKAGPAALAEALAAAERQRARAGRPRERALLVCDAARFRFVLGEPDPRNLGIGVRDGRHDTGIEKTLQAGRDLGRDLAFVTRFMSQHRLPDDVADREDVRHVRALLLVDLDQPALVRLDAGLLRRDLAAVRAASDGDEH